ncbi:alpha/beta hydrolase [Dysgonomonas sp. ZJ709]|uniref:alpha/beta hydrolase n=1 Tax=Dysgonomonas sp. ZJ709 TaxID=2709797 RepID=UPI0013EB5D58|nr:alpha/beta hydrolase [Dysgonomonas sp. ZJ709]
MKNKFIYTLFLALLVSISSFGSDFTKDDEIKKETFIFSIKGNDTLRLDKYDLPSITGQKPCIIFVFGGGFTSGERDQKAYVDYFNQLVAKGYAVVSIDYRLGIKMALEAGKKQEAQTGKKAKMGGREAVGVMDHAITIAVEDLFDATNFVLQHAQEWNIDKDKIISCGSSAGAITVLHGEYEISNNTELAKRLPEDFNYAGVISFAGAIFSIKGDLKWQEKPAPMLMFHGDADSNVPYNKLTIIFTKFGFYGSKHIAEKLSKEKYPYYFYSVENAAHEIANTPMSENLNEINTFIDKFVIGKQNLIINTDVKDLNKQEMRKKFGIKDYLRANGLGS